MLPRNFTDGVFGEGIKNISSLKVFLAALTGLIVGWFISAITEYYTGLGKKPVLELFKNLVLGQPQTLSLDLLQV